MLVGRWGWTLNPGTITLVLLSQLLKSFCNESIIAHYDVVLNEQWLNVLWAAVVSIFIVGGCTGSILGAVLADRFGRKKATIAISGLWVAGALLFGFCRAANSVEMLILGRLIVGLSGGGVDDWPYLLSVYVLLVIFCLPILFILPESPKYLFVVKRNEESALRELSRLRGVSTSVLNEDLDLLREEARASEAASLSGEQHWSMIRVLKDPRLRLPLLLTCTMQAGQQTSGINAVFYYSQTIFKQAGLNETNSQYATIACGFINVCTAVLMLYMLPKVGRRPLLLGSILAATGILAALAASMRFIDVVSWMPYACMAAVLAYVLVYGLGLGPIPYFIASEIFEVGPRPAGMAWGSLANWGGNFVVGMSFPTMRDCIGPYSFLVFSAVTGLLFVFQKVYFPETRGKTPAHITQLCSRGFRSRPLVRVAHNGHV
ncbi:hypothetical protein ABMA27_014245 [Loxostege sticticalis]|uniref:Major facilitator superfamily (MFS) profile domain-containing protein n=1 Tax=Loxostege sticticalis TaxID=481309 RepID=A0ABR3IDA4_LOXSC